MPGIARPPRQQSSVPNPEVMKPSRNLDIRGRGVVDGPDEACASPWRRGGQQRCHEGFRDASVRRGDANGREEEGQGEQRGRAAARKRVALQPLPSLRLLLLFVCVWPPESGPMFLPVANGELRPESDLTSNCFDFPRRNFDRMNSIRAVNGGNTPYLPLSTGADAIDFTLHDLAGGRWNLRETLERTGLPVVMVWGMYTCPGFQGYGTSPPSDKCGYWDERQLVETYKDRATFVHMYGPEPHPAMPGTNFDVGTTWQSYWSVFKQHRSYDDRVLMAERISSNIHPDQTILIDYLPGNPYSELIQPVWCSYAMGARPVTMVTPDGKLFFQRAWFHSDHVGRAIEEYLCQQEQRQQQGEEAGEVAESLTGQRGDSARREREPRGELGREGVYSPGGARGSQYQGSWEPGEKGEGAAAAAAGGGYKDGADGITINGFLPGGESEVTEDSPWGWWCLPAEEGGDPDMGEPGIPPLAGVLSPRGASGASMPPWWEEGVP